MSKLSFFSVATALLLFTLQPQVADAQPVSGISSVKMFELADEMRAAGRLGDAEAIYQALARNPDLEIRTEARFRFGSMLAAEARPRDAAVVFRALLDEQPNAPRVRIELARILAELGDMTAAARELRQAQSAGLPPDVARVVDQFATALRSFKPFGATFEVAIAPDSNINRATEARTLETVIAPIDLNRDARARSGLGLKVAGQAFARLPLGQRASLLPRISGSGDLYGASRFNDISGRIQVGIERSEIAAGRATLSIGQSWRWFGGDPYLRMTDATLDWLRPSGKRAQFTVSASLGTAKYPINRQQDGQQFGYSMGYERALSPQSGGSVKIDMSRQTARDPGYSNVATGISGLYFRDVGRVTMFGSVAIRRLWGDKPFFLFQENRREWLVRTSLGATFRQATIRGFAPLVRLTYERNLSTVPIYDYRRRAVEMGISRAF